MDNSQRYLLTFVCLGNICRSPMAETVAHTAARTAGLNGKIAIRSAGLANYHLGEPADPRARAVLTENGYLHIGRAQLFDPAWFDDDGRIVPMDRANLNALRELAPTPEARSSLQLLRAYRPGRPGPVIDVPDPYAGTMDDFRRALAMIEQSMPGLMHAIAMDLLRVQA